MITAYVLIWRNSPLEINGPWVDQLEVCREYERQGFDDELLAGLEEYLGVEIECTSNGNN